MRFEGTSGQRYGEMEAEVVRLKMQRNGLEIERDSLKRCCEALESRIASLEAFAEEIRRINDTCFSKSAFIEYVENALAKLDGKE